MKHIKRGSIRKGAFYCGIRGLLGVLAITMAVSLGVEPVAWALVIDATGGGCAAIGTWDLQTKTCTLNQNVTGTIYI